MAPGERLPKAARKNQNCPLPKLCYAAQLRFKISRNQGKPQDRDAPAKDQEKEVGRIHPGEEPDEGVGLSPAPASTVRHGGTSQVWGASPTLPSNLV